eukprot:c26447_g1_i1 orf=466-1014(+)
MAGAKIRALSFIRNHAKTVCVTILVFTFLSLCPLLLLFSPPLLFISLSAVGFLSFARCIWKLRDTEDEAARKRDPCRCFRNARSRGNMEEVRFERGLYDDDDGRFRRTRSGMESEKQWRVEAYLEDQLRSSSLLLEEEEENKRQEEGPPPSFHYGVEQKKPSSNLKRRAFSPLHPPPTCTHG